MRDPRSGADAQRNAGRHGQQGQPRKGNWIPISVGKGRFSRPIATPSDAACQCPFLWPGVGWEGFWGMIGVDMIGDIRRAYFEQRWPIKEIVRTLSVSRATVRKVIRGQRPSSSMSAAFSRHRNWAIGSRF